MFLQIGLSTSSVCCIFAAWSNSIRREHHSLSLPGQPIVDRWLQVWCQTVCGCHLIWPSTDIPVWGGTYKVGETIELVIVWNRNAIHVVMSSLSRPYFESTGLSNFKDKCWLHFVSQKEHENPLRISNPQ